MVDTQQRILCLYMYVFTLLYVYCLCVHPQVHGGNVCRMSSTFVTLAEVLEARGGPLLEDEVWSLLLGTAESLVDVSYKGKALFKCIFTTSLNYDCTSDLLQCKCNIST